MFNLKTGWLASLLAVIPLFNGCAMAKETVLLWPAIEGQILNQGKPVPGLELTQTLYWNYEPEGTPPRVAVARTDSQGRFSFPRVTGEVRPHFLFRLLHQPGIGLAIDTFHEDKQIGLLASTRGSYGPSDKKILNCDVGKLREFDGGLLAECDLSEKTK